MELLNFLFSNTIIFFKVHKLLFFCIINLDVLIYILYFHILSISVVPITVIML